MLIRPCSCIVTLYMRMLLPHGEPPFSMSFLATPMQHIIPGHFIDVTLLHQKSICCWQFFTMPRLAHGACILGRKALCVHCGHCCTEKLQPRSLSRPYDKRPMTAGGVPPREQWEAVGRQCVLDEAAWPRTHEAWRKPALGVPQPDAALGLISQQVQEHFLGAAHPKHMPQKCSSPRHTNDQLAKQSGHNRQVHY